jgi:hypothetical protein
MYICLARAIIAGHGLPRLFPGQAGMGLRHLLPAPQQEIGLRAHCGHWADLDR